MDNFNLDELMDLAEAYVGPMVDAIYRRLIERDCNIRPEDTYRRITKLSLKTTGQRLNRALHVFHRLYQASTFRWSFLHQADKNVTVLRLRPERSN